jgi:hypothetical protein
MAEAPRQYETFEASELFCARCRQARPVRKHLLLVLPTGNKYDYRCAVHATSVGSKMDSDNKVSTPSFLAGPDLTHRWGWLSGNTYPFAMYSATTAMSPIGGMPANPAILTGAGRAQQTLGRKRYSAVVPVYATLLSQGMLHHLLVGGACRLAASTAPGFA